MYLHLKKGELQACPSSVPACVCRAEHGSQTARGGAKGGGSRVCVRAHLRWPAQLSPLPRRQVWAQPPASPPAPAMAALPSPRPQRRFPTAALAGGQTDKAAPAAPVPFPSKTASSSTGLSPRLQGRWLHGGRSSRVATAHGTRTGRCCAVLFGFIIKYILGGGTEGDEDRDHPL